MPMSGDFTHDVAIHSTLKGSYEWYLTFPASAFDFLICSGDVKVLEDLERTKQV